MSAAPATIDIVRCDTPDAIMGIMQSAFDPAYGEAWTYEQCRSTLLLPGCALMVAEEDGTAIGFALTSTVFENSELLLLAVAPIARNRNIGKMLVEQWRDHARSNGVSKLFLEVRENNPARKFYTLLGFEPVGVRPDYYKCPDGTQLCAVTMAKEIGDVAAK